MAIVGNNGCLNIFSQEGNLHVNYTGNSWLVMPKSIGGSQPLLWPCTFITTDSHMTDAPPYLNTSPNFQHHLESSTDEDSFAGFASKTSGHLTGSWARLCYDDAHIPHDARLVFAGIIGSGALGPLNYQPYTLKITDATTKQLLFHEKRQGDIINFTPHYNTECCWVDNITDLLLTTLSDCDIQLNIDLSSLSKIMPRRCHGWVLFVVYEHHSFPYELVDIFAQTQARKPSSQKRQLTSPSQLKSASLSIASGHIDRNSGGYIYLDLGDHTLLLSGPHNKNDYFSNGRRYNYLGDLMNTGSFANLPIAPELPNIITDDPFVGGFSLTHIDLTQSFKSLPHLRSETCIPGKTTNTIGFALEQVIESPFGSCQLIGPSSPVHLDDVFSCTVHYQAGRGGMQNIRLFLELPSSLNSQLLERPFVDLPALKAMESSTFTFELHAQSADINSFCKIHLTYDLTTSSHQPTAHTLMEQVPICIESQAELIFSFTTSDPVIKTLGTMTYYLSIENIGHTAAQKTSALFSLPLQHMGCMRFDNESAHIDCSHATTHFSEEDHLLLLELPTIPPKGKINFFYTLTLTAPCRHLPSDQEMITHLCITYFDSIHPSTFLKETLLKQTLSCSSIHLELSAPKKIFSEEWFDYTLSIEHLGNIVIPSAYLYLDCPHHEINCDFPVKIEHIEPYTSDFLTFKAKASALVLENFSGVSAYLVDEKGDVLCRSETFFPPFHVLPVASVSTLPIKCHFLVPEAPLLLGETLLFTLEILNYSDYTLEHLSISHLVPENFHLIDDMSHELPPLLPHSIHRLTYLAQALLPSTDPVQVTLYYHYQDIAEHTEYLNITLASPAVVSPNVTLSIASPLDFSIPSSHYTGAITLSNDGDLHLSRLTLKLKLPSTTRLIPETLSLSQPKLFRCNTSGELYIENISAHETLTFYFTLYPTEPISPDSKAFVDGEFSIIHPDSKLPHTFSLSQLPLHTI